MKKMNLSLVVNSDSIQIIHNGKEIIKSIHIFSQAEVESKKKWMQAKIDKYNATGQFN